MWTDFTTSGIQIEHLMEYDPSLVIGSRTLNDFISLALADVEDILRANVYIKYREKGKSKPSDLPQTAGGALDAILSEGFPQIRKKCIYRCLMLIYINDPEAYNMWQSRYDTQPMSEVWIDIDQDSVLDSDEFTIDEDDLRIELR